MRLRSLLFTPGDRPERFDKALASGADAVILDLEDSVAPANKAMARQAVRAALERPVRPARVFVRINPLGGLHLQADLAAIGGGRPDGVVMPKAEGAGSLTALARLLSEAGEPDMAILPIVTETPAAMFKLGEYGEVASSLVGLTWGAEDLPAALGASTSREADGTYTPPYALARSLTLFAAGAADVAAIETVFPDVRDLEGLKVYAERGRRDGFSGMLALHPAQVPVINAAFAPGDAELAFAKRVVAAFDAAPGAGVLLLDGKMVDAPHLKQARRVLSQAEGA